MSCSEFSSRPVIKLVLCRTVHCVVCSKYISLSEKWQLEDKIIPIQLKDHIGKKFVTKPDNIFVDNITVIDTFDDSCATGLSCKTPRSAS